MTRRELWICGAVAMTLLASRFITMTLLPMSDTTEPRYAEIARLMLESGDWITPWLEPGIPFWGKPPLSFWLQALSMRLLGVGDFAARLPAWIAVLGTLVLAGKLASHLGGARLATRTVLILATMALTWVAAGAVMTDAFLAFGTTLGVVSYLLAADGKRQPWGWLFFIGISIGLLSKGPLALVLTGAPILAWSLWNLRWRSPLPALPWLGGSALTAVLVLPWYIAAELKTPGFLNYFIVGEHFGRFVVPGWEGDLYGNAHDEPRGMIWAFLLWASFPWGLIGGAMLLRTLTRGPGREALRAWLTEPAHGLLLAAALTTPLFFSLAGNTLWTYLLPSLPFVALLIAIRLQTAPLPRLIALAALVPAIVTALGVHLSMQPETLKSEAALVAAFMQHRGDTQQTLHYAGDLPHSARYYARNQVRRIALEDISRVAASAPDGPLFVAVRNADMAQLTGTPVPAFEPLFRGRSHTLLRIDRNRTPPFQR